RSHSLRTTHRLIPFLHLPLPFSFTFFFHCYRAHQYLHSFPTRRSSDLAVKKDPLFQDRLNRNHEIMMDSIRILNDTRNLVTFTGDRKSTRLNSSHVSISYAVFCLKKKKKNTDCV